VRDPGSHTLDRDGIAECLCDCDRLAGVGAELAGWKRDAEVGERGLARPFVARVSRLRHAAADQSARRSAPGCEFAAALNKAGGMAEAGEGVLEALQRNDPVLDQQFARRSGNSFGQIGDHATWYFRHAAHVEHGMECLIEAIEMHRRRRVDDDRCGIGRLRHQRDERLGLRIAVAPLSHRDVERVHRRGN